MMTYSNACCMLYLLYGINFLKNFRELSESMTAELGGQVKKET